MSFLSILTGIMILSVLLVAAFWIGIYIVLPIVLVVLVISSITSLIRLFFSSDAKKTSIHREQNKIIDVEFEEIK